jgi:hypothetical protein
VLNAVRTITETQGLMFGFGVQNAPDSCVKTVDFMQTQ